MIRVMLFWGLVFAFGLPSVAEAGRRLIVSPIQFEGVFGGRGGTAGAPGAVCGDADMEGGVFPASARSKAEVAGYFFSVSLTNLAASAAKARITLAPGTSVQSYSSPPAAEAAPGALTSTAPGAPKIRLNDRRSMEFTIAPYESVIRLVSFFCSANTCSVCLKGNGQRGSVCNQSGDTLVLGSDPQLTATPAPGRVCLYILGLLNVEVEALEDRGILNGMINTQPGRSNGTGQAYKAISTPADFALNGGRAF